MAININDNFKNRVNRPTDFRFGPFISIEQANSFIPIAQRYHGLIFGVYTNTGSIADSDITYYYYSDALTNTDYRPLFEKYVPYTGSTRDVDLGQYGIAASYYKMDPYQDPNPSGTDLDSTYLFQSSSNTSLGYDLYIRQNGNLTKWKWVEGLLESGLLYGGIVTYSGSTVYVSPGSGIIVDHNATTGSEIGPVVDYVTWGPITSSITNVTSSQVTYLYIDDSGSLQQQSTRFTSEQYHNYIPLGAVGHFDYTQVNAFGGAVRTAYDQIGQISDFVDAFGPLKISGYAITGQAGSLQISVSAGKSFVHGGFYAENPEYPSNITTNTQLTASMAYVYRSGSTVVFDTNGGNLYTSLRPGFYDPGTGTVTPVSNNNWTVQRVFSDPKTGVLYVYYGQNIYPSYNDALADLSSDSFTEGDTFDFTTFLGFLILKSNTTDITSISDNKIIPAGLFRGTAAGAGGGGGGAEALDDLSDVAITSPINGQALVYQSGTWLNGYPSSASFADLAAGLTNTLAVTSGGTGVTTLTGVVIGNGTSPMTAITGSASQLLRRNAADTAYEFFTHDFINQAGARSAISLTTIGTSGSATYNNTTGVLNIPNYTYTHPIYTPRSIDTSGAEVIDIIASDTIGSITNITTRTLTLADLGYTGVTNADNYNSWLLAASGTAGTAAITSGATVTLSAGAGMNVTRSSNTVTFATTITQYTDALARAAISLTTTGTSGVATYNSSSGIFNIPNYTYTHPAYTPVSETLTGASVLASFSSDAIGSVTGFTTRSLSPGDIGAEPAFGKGDLVEGVGIALSGSLEDRLVGLGDVKISSTGVVQVRTTCGNVSITDNTDFYALIDITSGPYSSSQSNRQILCKALTDWFNDYKILNPNFTGNLYIGLTSSERYVGYLPAIRDYTAHSSLVTVSNWLDANAVASSLNAPPNWGNVSWVPPTDTLILAFTNESNADYHGSQTTPTLASQPFTNYNTDYNNFTSSYAAMTNFAGIVYPAVSVSNAVDRNFLLHIYAVLYNDATVTGSDLVEPFGANYTSSFDTVNEPNPYVTQNKGLWNYNWVGILNKGVVGGVLNFTSQEFENDLNSLLVTAQPGNTSIVESFENQTLTLRSLTSSDSSVSISLTSGGCINLQTTPYTDADARDAISLTTIGTSGAATYDNVTGVLNIPQYQTVLTNPITGTGTTNYVPKFTPNGSTLGNSLIYDDGTTVMIGTTTSPSPVVGVSFPFSVTSNQSTRIRIDSTQAVPNAGVGLYANGVQKFSFAMYGATSDFTIYNDALTTPSILVKGDTNNFLIGTLTDSGDKLRVNGTVRIDNVTNATGDFVTIDANSVLRRRTAAEVRSDIGAFPSTSITIASGQVAFGTGTNTIGGSNSLFWDSFNTRLGIGTNTPSSTLHIVGRVTQTGFGTSTFFGESAGATGIVSTFNSAFGYNALPSLTAGNIGFNTSIGADTLTSLTSGITNTAVGASVLNALTTQMGNTAVGRGTANNHTGNNGTFIGESSALNKTSGDDVVVIGRTAARYLADGVTAAQIFSNSVYIGNNSRVGAASATNEIVIGHTAIGGGSNTTTIGNSSTVSTRLPAGSLWVNTTSGTNTIDVNGTARIRTISNLGTAATEFLTQDALGVISKRTAAEVLSDIGAQAELDIISLAELNAGTALTERSVNSKNLNDWLSTKLSLANGYTQESLTYTSSNTFTLTQSNPMAENVYIHGQRKRPGLDYIISGNQITFLDTLQPSFDIKVTYFYSIPGVGLSGTGVTNYITKWSGSTSLAISQLFDNGTNIGIGTTTPSVFTEIANGSVRLSGTMQDQTLTGQTGISASGYYTALAVQPIDGLNDTTSSRFYYGSVNSVSATSTNTGSTFVFGGFFSARGTRTVAGNLSLYGITAYGIKNDASDLSNSGSLFGGIFNAGHQSSLNNSVISAGATGTNTVIQAQKGTITTTYGTFNSIAVSTQASTSGTVGTHYGFYSQGTVGRSDGTTVGTITTYYDVYLAGATVHPNSSITNRWGLYQANSAHTNYFAGNVLIGTTTDSGVKLNAVGTGVFGTMTASRGIYSNGLSLQNSTGQATSLFLLQDGIASSHIGSKPNDTNLYIVNSYNTGTINESSFIALTSSGNVGIGTSSPSAKLEVSGAGYIVKATASGSDSSYFQAVNGAYNYVAGVATALGVGLMGMNSDHPLVIMTNATERMRITSGGNVLVGTTTDSGNGRLTIFETNTARLFLTDNTLGTSFGGQVRGYGVAGVGGFISLGTIDANLYNEAIRVREQAKGIQFYINSGANGSTSERARISESGNLLISTTTDAGEKLQVNGNALITKALISNQENLDVDSAAAEVVAQISSTTYTAVFFDYSIKNGTNVRSGTVYATHNGTNVVYVETSTADLGDTSGVELSVDLNGGNIRLLATVTSDNWVIKSLVRGL